MTIKDYHDRIIFIGYSHRAKDFQEKHIIPIMKEGYSVEYSEKDFNKGSKLRQHTWCLRKIDNKEVKS
tara:strand:+ start:368 stop:571 length:204 start_codon:yes stop_codon:yes gene_type:complete